MVHTNTHKSWCMSEVVIGIDYATARLAQLYTVFRFSHGLLIDLQLVSSTITYFKTSTSVVGTSTAFY